MAGEQVGENENRLGQIGSCSFSHHLRCCSSSQPIYLPTNIASSLQKNKKKKGERPEALLEIIFRAGIDYLGNKYTMFSHTETTGLSLLFSSSHRVFHVAYGTEEIMRCGRLLGPLAQGEPVSHALRRSRQKMMIKEKKKKKSFKRLVSHRPKPLCVRGVFFFREKNTRRRKKKLCTDGSPRS